MYLNLLLSSKGFVQLLHKICEPPDEEKAHRCPSLTRKRLSLPGAHYTAVLPGIIPDFSQLAPRPLALLRFG
jgi:hypothetical protein